MAFPRVRVLGDTVGPSLTKASDALASDVNQIIKRWVAHGEVPLGPSGPPKYGDFSVGSDFFTASTMVKAAEADFGRLPSAVRSMCQNDVSVFLEKIYTSEGRAELAKAGMPEARVPEGAPEKAPEVVVDKKGAPEKAPEVVVDKAK